jgi:outer membrane protein assembly factor BamE (lipoprotein component of BamABCDE complex)
MKTSKTLLLSAAALCAVWLAGCQTPESRIKGSPEVFARLTPDQQAMVKAGQVGIGFTPDAVKLALGDPTRVTERVDATGKTEVWHYTEYETNDGVFLYTGYYHSWRGGPWGWGGGWGPGWGGYPYYDAYPNRRERDHIRVSFNTAGTVSAVEQENP